MRLIRALSCLLAMFSNNPKPIPVRQLWNTFSLKKIRVLSFLTKKEKVCLIVLLEIHNSNILKSNNKGTKILSGSNVYKEYKFNSNLFFIYRNQETQTKRENSTSVPKPSVFIAGLRGSKTTRTIATKVDLTLGVDQIWIVFLTKSL